VLIIAITVLEIAITVRIIALTVLIIAMGSRWIGQTCAETGGTL
jgi:hypothetical protein